MYKINKKRITINFYLPSIILIVATIFLIFMIYLSITEGEEYGIALIPIIFALVIMYFCIKGIKRWSNKLSSVKKLEKTGKLVRNLPYDIMIKRTASTDGGDTTDYYAVVNYKVDGKEVELVSLCYSNSKCVSNRKYIDLLYDENDMSNYYLDFDIEEVGENNE